LAQAMNLVNLEINPEPACWNSQQFGQSSLMNSATSSGGELHELNVKKRST